IEKTGNDGEMGRRFKELGPYLTNAKKKAKAAESNTNKKSNKRTNFLLNTNFTIQIESGQGNKTDWNCNDIVNKTDISPNIFSVNHIYNDLKQLQRLKKIKINENGKISKPRKALREMNQIQISNKTDCPYKNQHYQSFKRAKKIFKDCYLEDRHRKLEMDRLSSQINAITKNKPKKKRKTKPQQKSIEEGEVKKKLKSKVKRKSKDKANIEEGKVKKKPNSKVRRKSKDKAKSKRKSKTAKEHSFIQIMSPQMMDIDQNTNNSLHLPLITTPKPKRFKK
ncbi:MAG: hypothetical protein GY938_08930, partial [Ketobacter sp.]|nr:hypothetical protein [Ketobacter sp.]